MIRKTSILLLIVLMTTSAFALSTISYSRLVGNSVFMPTQKMTESTTTSKSTAAISLPPISPPQAIIGATAGITTPPVGAQPIDLKTTIPTKQPAEIGGVPPVMMEETKRRNQVIEPVGTKCGCSFANIDESNPFKANIVTRCQVFDTRCGGRTCNNYDSGDKDCTPQNVRSVPLINPNPFPWKPCYVDGCTDECIRRFSENFNAKNNQLSSECVENNRKDCINHFVTAAKAAGFTEKEALDAAKDNLPSANGLKVQSSNTATLKKKESKRAVTFVFTVDANGWNGMNGVIGSCS